MEDARPLQHLGRMPNIAKAPGTSVRVGFDRMFLAGVSVSDDLVLELVRKVDDTDLAERARDRLRP